MNSPGNQQDKIDPSIMQTGTNNMKTVDMAPSPKRDAAEWRA